MEEDIVPSSSPVAPPLPLTKAAGRPSSRLRSLEHQLRVLSDASQPQEEDPDSLIQFHDIDFPLDDTGAAAKTRKKKPAEKREHALFGSPDVDEPFSDVSCPGCGAVLHCTALAVPGYLPSEKYKVLRQEGRLGGATCQRCHLLTHHHKAMNLQVTSDQYRAVVQNIRPLRALVLLIVDLLDLPDSIVPNLTDLVGTNKHIVVLGNKVDLLPADSPNYLQRIRRQLSAYCRDAGFGDLLRDVHLVSAKTGYGVEALVSSLQQSWKYKGDVYLVGVANAGKSTLFNALLESDYCKSRASDVTRKATISPWPGKTEVFRPPSTTRRAGPPPPAAADQPPLPRDALTVSLLRSLLLCPFRDDAEPAQVSHHEPDPLQAVPPPAAPQRSVPADGGGASAGRAEEAPAPQQEGLRRR